MDPRKFKAPMQCSTCNLLCYTLQEVSQHRSFHDTINFIYHCCLVNFDSMPPILTHMEQKGANLRKPLDLDTYLSAYTSPTTSATTSVLPLTQPAPQSTPTFSDSSPVTKKTFTDDIILNRIMKVIGTQDTVQAIPDTDVSDSSGITPFEPQAASSQQPSLGSPEVLPAIAACPQTPAAAYPPAEYRQLRKQNTEQKSLL